MPLPIPIMLTLPISGTGTGAPLPAPTVTGGAWWLAKSWCHIAPSIATAMSSSLIAACPCPNVGSMAMKSAAQAGGGGVVDLPLTMGGDRALPSGAMSNRSVSLCCSSRSCLAPARDDLKPAEDDDADGPGRPASSEYRSCWSDRSWW